MGLLDQQKAANQLLGVIGKDVILFRQSVQKYFTVNARNCTSPSQVSPGSDNSVRITPKKSFHLKLQHTPTGSASPGNIHSPQEYSEIN